MNRLPVAILSLVLLAAIATPSFAAREKPQPSTTVAFDTVDLTLSTERPSGEITIQTSYRHAGVEYPVSLSFRNFDEANGISLQDRSVELSEISELLVVGVDGEPRVIAVDSIDGIFDLVERTQNTVCGSATARTFVYLGETAVAMDFGHPDGDVKPLLRASETSGGEGDFSSATPAPIGGCYYFSKDDANDDCDRFAIGGCGGPDCSDYLQKTCFPSEGLPYTEWYTYTTGTCKARVVNWGLDTCFCNSAGGTVTKFCWNPATQQHDPC